MKKILLIAAVALVLSSCGKSEIRDNISIERIDILDGKEHKYSAKLFTSPNSSEAYLFTNTRFQVGDTFCISTERTERDAKNMLRMAKQNDSLKKELIVTKYYLEILKERMISIDTLKRK